MPVARHTHVKLHRDGGVRRREFIRTLAAGSATAAACSWTDRMSLEAAELRRRGKACILLWMQGGPSQFETFSPKSGATGGDVKSISTAAPGVKIAENLPQTAAVMDDVCVFRSLTSSEGSHPRGSFLMHTGYVPNASVKHPTLGSLVAHELGDAELELPSFVRIGNTGRGGAGGGFLGVDYAPFSMTSALRPPNNTQPATPTRRYRRRLGLLDRLETDFAAAGGKQVVADHRKLYGKASQMILSPEMTAFDISQEPDKIRDGYGRSEFGAGCLLARRLVEAGVTFVEVGLGNWDTHQDNQDRTAALCRRLDRPYAQLLADLKDRGLLDDTLVIWMGEFGRTPRINPRGGRDHYPTAFNAALAGGGIRGGQVIGRTDAAGAEVDDRPVSVHDLFQTFCRSLGIDADNENMSGVGRPIKIVDGGAPVLEAFG